MAEFRPIIKLRLTTLAMTIELSTLVVLLVTSIYIAAIYSDLPDMIPTHFGFAGKANNFGSKSSLIFFAALSWFIYFLLSLLNTIPQHFNYIVKITPENAERQYKLGTSILRILKCIIALVFSILIYFIVHSSKVSGTMPTLLLPIIFSLISLPICYHIYQSIKTK